MGRVALLRTYFAEHGQAKSSVLALGAAAALLTLALRGGEAGTADAVIQAALSERGLETEQVLGVDRPYGPVTSAFGSVRYAVRAHEPGGPNEIYLARVEEPAAGGALRMTALYNLTRSYAADEQALVVSPSGRRMAYAIVNEGATESVHILDFDGVAGAELEGHDALQRTQARITNAQQTGQFEGVRHSYFAPSAQVKNLQFAFNSEELLELKGDGAAFTLDLSTGATSPLAAGRFAQDERARPPALAPWAVDRVRAFDWVGEERMQWVKAFAFTALGWVHEASGGVAAPDAEEPAEPGASLPPTTTTAPAGTAPAPAASGFPPPALVPVFTPAGAGEGQWTLLAHDPFMPETAALAPQAFAQAYLRTDKARPLTRVTITLWDPRLVSLHMTAGTVEPLSANGQAGPGVIERNPELMTRVVAGFNGGFQAVHGEYGMQADRTLYLPPKPYAATVMAMDDGSTAFGTWPASEPVPDSVVGFRQNMTALVEHATFNPWGRTWWGGTPPGWADNIHTTRSGLCLTKHGHIGYFYGVDLGPEALAEGMLHAECIYGMHLDMNPGLAGFEFYRVAKDSDWKPLGRALVEAAETEGTLKDLPGYKFRARRMIRSMGHINFPQYIHRDTRDFFYLTLRPSVLSGGANTSGSSRDSALQFAPVGPATYPPALAAADVEPGPGGGLRAYRMDPNAVTFGGVANPATGTLPPTTTLASLESAENATHMLSMRGSVIAVEAAEAAGAATVVARGTTARSAVSMVLAIYPNGLLGALCAEGHAAIPPEKSDAWLQREGLGHALYIQNGALRVGGSAVPAAGAPEPPKRGRAGQRRGTAARDVAETPRLTVQINARATAGARLLFDPEGVPREVWQPLQAQRVRYKRAPKPAASAEPGSPTPAPSGAPDLP